MSLKTIFPDLCGLFWVCLGQTFTEKTGNQELSPTPPLLSLSSFSSSISLSLSVPISISIPSLPFLYYCFFPPAYFSLPFISPISPSVWRFFINLDFWVLVLLCDLMSKKMKRVVMESSPYAVYDDAKSRFKHQSLLQDYHELQKETEAMRRKLQSVKQDKLTLLAEVRFLRRRYKYLLKNNAPPKTPPKPEFKQKQSPSTQLKNIPREKNQSGKQAAAMRNPALGFGGNMKERIYKGKMAGMANPDSSYELNQKSRGYSPKEAAALRNPVPVGRNPVPFLDLNKISREEEEEEEEEGVQVNVESVGVEEQQQQQMKSVIRGGVNGNDDQLSDMKLSACRNIGNGPNRAGKRKISWQDQLALRV